MLGMKSLLKIATVVSLGIVGSSAHASVINLFGTTGDPGLLRASIDCGGDCLGLETGGTWSSTRGDMFTVHPPSDANELAFVNTYVDPDFLANGTKDNSGATAFTSTALYILFKIGGGNEFATALIHNTSGGLLNFSFTQIATGSGLSHISEFGEACPPDFFGCGPPVNVIPLPAGLPLLLSALGIGAILRRKGRKQA